MGSLAEQRLLDTNSHDDQLDQTGKLEASLSSLEEERLRMEAFKHELPLCMQLLNNVIEAYRKQLVSYQEQRAPLQLEFVPLGKIASNGGESPSTGNLEKSRRKEQSKDSINDATSLPRLAVDGKQRNGGIFILSSKDKPPNGNFPDLSPSDSKQREGKKFSDIRRMRMTDDHIVTNGRTNDSSVEVVNIAAPKKVKTGLEGRATVVGNLGGGTHRKVRRRWTPELHQRFVNALHMLGGSQVSTPKQIRELMKVDGLTNDEVKSHLQKYRLHARRALPTAASPSPSQLVVLRGLWVPSENAAGATVYGPHTTTGITHHRTSTPISQDFHPQPASPHLHHHHHHYHQPSSPVVAARFNHKSVTMTCNSGLRNGNSSVPNVKNNGVERLEGMENGEDGVAGAEEEKGKPNSGRWKQGEESCDLS